MIKILKNVPKEIQKHFKKSLYKKGEYILNQGDNNEDLYFILSGSLEVLTVTSLGTPVAIRTFEKDESIGVLEIFGTSLETQTVVALEDSSVIKLNKKYVEKWMKLDFEFTLYIICLYQDLF